MSLNIFKNMRKTNKSVDLSMHIKKWCKTVESGYPWKLGVVILISSVLYCTLLTSTISILYSEKQIVFEKD